MAGAYGIRRRIWLAALVAVLGTGAVVALVLRAAAERRAHRPTSPSGEVQELAFAGPRLQHPEALPGLPDSLEGLIDVYARRTDDPSARAQRGAALRAIFRETDPSRRLFAALGRLEQRAENLDDRRLAGAVGTEQSEDLAGGNRERNVIHSRQVAEAANQPLDLDGKSS